KKRQDLRWLYYTAVAHHNQKLIVKYFKVWKFSLYEIIANRHYTIKLVTTSFKFWRKKTIVKKKNIIRKKKKHKTDEIDIIFNKIISSNDVAGTIKKYLT